LVGRDANLLQKPLALQGFNKRAGPTVPFFRGMIVIHITDMAKKHLDKTAFFLGSCSTCQEILKTNGLEQRGFLMREIKSEPVTPAELDAMKGLAGSFEALFSRRAIKYREMGLSMKVLKEEDYRRLILEEYTFLRRPVVISGGRIFIGSEKATKQALSDHLGA
jgi:arsenate reductase